MKKIVMAVALLTAVATGAAQAQSVKPATGSSSTVGTGTSADSSTQKSTLDNVGQSGQGVSTGTRNELGTSGTVSQSDSMAGMSGQGRMKKDRKMKNKNKNRRGTDTTSTN